MLTADTFVGLPIRLLASLGLPPPVMRLLAAVRRDALEAVLPEARAEAAPLVSGLSREDPEAAVAFAALAERSLARLDAEVARATNGGGRGAAPSLLAALHRLDRRFHACDRRELMDDPALAPPLRARLVARLDALNQLLGTYDAFLRAVEPFLVASPTAPGAGSRRPLRVLELAAGAGGFSLWLARHARRRGLALQVIATDLEEGFLEPARRAARAEGLALETRSLDALRLSSYPEAVDVVVCAQALHHFPSGLLAHLFHCAADRARRGVVFVDGCRSALLAAGFLGLGALRYADPAFLHDAWVSFRRFYVPEELALLCRLGPRGDRVRARHVAPGHCLVTRAAPPADARPPSEARGS